MTAQVRDPRRFWLYLLLLAAGALLAAGLSQGPSAQVARRTVLLCLAVCAVSLPVGSMLAFLAVRTDLPGRRLVLWLLGGMLFVPLYVQAAGWVAGFGLQGGVTLGWGTDVWLDGFRGALWVHAVAAIPWVALLVGAGLWLVERELEELALLDAAPLRVFTAVTVPRSAAAAVAAAMWVAVAIAGEMTVTDLFQVRTYAEMIYVENAAGLEPGEAPLAILPSILVVGWLVTAGLLLCGQVVTRFRQATPGRPHVFPLGRWRWPCAALVGGVMSAVAGAPLASLLYKAGVVVVQTETGRRRGWSAAQCLETIVDALPGFHLEIGWTLAIGSLAATLALLIGIHLAWWARTGGLSAAPGLSIVALLMATPGPLVGLAIIWALNRPDPLWLTSLRGVEAGDGVLGMLYDHPLVALTAAQCARALPLTTLICWASLRSVPIESLDVAATAGAGPLALLYKVALPQRRVAMALAWLVALALAAGDLSASVLVAPPGVKTLSIQVFEQIHYGAESQLAGLCLSVLAIYAAVAVTAACAWRLRGTRRVAR